MSYFKLNKAAVVFSKDFVHIQNNLVNLTNSRWSISYVLRGQTLMPLIKEKQKSFSNIIDECGYNAPNKQ